MHPRSLFALRKAAMLGGMFLCFGVALSVYDRLDLDLPGLPLALHLAALIGPVLIGMALGYGLSGLVPLACPWCRDRIACRRVGARSRWRMPTYRVWCDRCQRDTVGG
jgi:hypothetical protein